MRIKFEIVWYFRLVCYSIAFRYEVYVCMYLYSSVTKIYKKLLPPGFWIWFMKKKINKWNTRGIKHPNESIWFVNTTWMPFLQLYCCSKQKMYMYIYYYYNLFTIAYIELYIEIYINTHTLYIITNVMYVRIEAFCTHIISI